MAERDVIAHRYVQVSDRIADLASPSLEPVLQPLWVRANDSQRRCQVELNLVLRLMGDHSRYIFDSHGLRPRIESDRIWASASLVKVSFVMVLLLVHAGREKS